jgi:hypothetical protein
MTVPDVFSVIVAAIHFGFCDCNSANIYISNAALRLSMSPRKRWIVPRKLGRSSSGLSKM